MLNKCFRAILVLISFYLLSLNISHIWVGYNSLGLNVLLTIAVILWIFEIIILIGMYKASSAWLNWTYWLIGLNIVVSYLVMSFTYGKIWLFVLGMIVILLTIVLLINVPEQLK